MTEPDPLLVEHPADGIVVLKLNRPQVRNALSLPLRKRIAEEMLRFGTDATTRVIVITGDEKAFAAGADVTEMAKANPIEVMARNVQQYYRPVSECPKPVIAAVEGFALGGGFELALCADFIVAGEGAKFGLPEVKLGILAGGGGTQRLVRLIGKQRALMLMLTGRFFTATEAHAMGAIADVAPAGEALKRALEIAGEIAAMPALSVMQIKEIVQAGLNAPLETALMLERKAFQLQFATQDQKEGMAAFIEKRKPTYQGK